MKALPAPWFLLAALLLGCNDRPPVTLNPDAGADATTDATVHLDRWLLFDQTYPINPWKCTTSKLGVVTCIKPKKYGGLPDAGDSWLCHLTQDSAGQKIWRCNGPAATLPGGEGWKCSPFIVEMGKQIYRCEKPDGIKDQPSDGKSYVCMKGDVYGGSRCQRVTSGGKPPPWPGPGPHGPCVAGQRMWCDDSIYSGWGFADCDPTTGGWKMRNINGTMQLDCSSKPANGKVPLTLCAKYHFYFNPRCCERIDCIVPENTDGQLNTPSAGALCDCCSPMKPECVEASAKCIVTNAHETFCGRACESAPCPGGYKCMKVKLKVGSVKQCVPADYSCYY